MGEKKIVDIVFDIRNLSSLQYCFARRGIGEDWDQFVEFVLNKAEEFARTTLEHQSCPFLPGSVSNIKINIQKLIIQIDASNETDADKIFEQIKEFAAFFYAQFDDFRDWDIPLIEDGVAFIGESIFVKYGEEHAESSYCWLSFNEEQTHASIEQAFQNK